VRKWEFSTRGARQGPKKKNGFKDFGSRVRLWCRWARSLSGFS
jgi:hypothetical protein